MKAPAGCLIAAGAPMSVTSAEIGRRGRAMRDFCDRVRQRGDVAETEEDEDLVTLRVAWLIARAAERAREGRP